MDQLLQKYKLPNESKQSFVTKKVLKNDHMSIVSIVKHTSNNDSKLIVMKSIPNKKDFVPKELLVLDLISSSSNCDTEFLISLVGLESNDFNLIMYFPYQESINLAEYIKAEETKNTNPIVKEEYALLICVQIAKGMRFLHNHGYIHRDIKSENVVCYLNGSVKLIDYGFCEAIGFHGERKGTAGATPPELWFSNAVYQPTSDIWSFGCILYEMLFGHLLYENIPDFWKNVREGTIHTKIIEEVSAFLDELAENKHPISEKCVVVFKSVLHVNPMLRCQTAGALIRLLMSQMN